MTKNTTTQQKDSIDNVFKAQKLNQYAVAQSSAKDRIKKLKKLHEAILKYRPAIKKALWEDFRKPEAEVDLSEIFIVTSDIKHVISNLKSWMSTKRVDTPLSLIGSSSSIHYEPKGVCLIISPWNFPFQLTFGPLISSIAAGNTTIIKPSEHTPNSSKLIKKIITELFEENEVAVFEGEVETSTELLKLPFNHIFFTGSPQVGKIVMKAAAENLASVTLELGGKSPTIIDETANIQQTAHRIAWGKYMNNGQICLAPDYVFIHESKKESFIESVKESLNTFYSNDIQATKDYSRISTPGHFERIKTMVEQSLAKGAKIVHGGNSDAAEKYFEPTLVTGVDVNSELMQNEIFGPILPILTFKDLKEPIDYINSKEKPLALYIYSKRKKNIDHIIKNTRAGGTAININNVHFSNPNLPFGGVNNSGIGKSHGKFGFEAFSNARGVYKQHFLGALGFFMPPFTDFKKKLIDWTIKWF